MSFNRHIIKDLIDWRTSPHRKPLILRGARQVGKTTLVQLFAKEFSHFVSINLERPQHQKYFTSYDDAKQITEALLLDFNIPFSELNQTLLFIDEIQESPKAIALLRYFYEDLPHLAVISAGSLLEFTLRNVQHFPVGRVQYLYLSPMNFDEFLQAIGQTQALKALHTIPVSQTAHSTLLRLFHIYTNLGGMPEVVKMYTETDSISSASSVYESIWNTYKDDVENMEQVKARNALSDIYLTQLHLRSIIVFHFKTLELLIIKAVKLVKQCEN
jgi:predicted AAA+ superfamily ATPase